MDEMRRLLDAEGLTGTPEMEAPKAETAEKKPKAKGAEEPPQDPAQSFREAREATGRTVIGQDAFLDSLFTAFRRPSVTGRENGKPAAVVVISGKEGTGRHSALAASAAALCKEGVLKNGEVTNIDLSRYPTPKTVNYSHRIFFPHCTAKTILCCLKILSSATNLCCPWWRRCARRAF